MTLDIDALETLIEGLAGLPYGREAVDQRTHALQTGWQARQAGADDECSQHDEICGQLHAHRTHQPRSIQPHRHQPPLCDLRLHRPRRQNADPVSQRHCFLNRLDIVEVHRHPNLHAQPA